MKLKITTIIAVILLIPYLILGGFLVYFLYDVDNCSPSWYYNAEMDDLKIDDALLAIINSHYKNVTVIPDPKVQERDNFQPELVQPLLNEEPEPPDETEILSDWLDIQVLQPQSHLTTRRPWKAYKPPEILPPDLDSDLVEENVAEATNKPESFVDFENDQNFEEIDQNLDEISKISRSEKRGKRRRKEHKRHGNNEKDKDHRTGKGSRSKKSRKRHKTDNTTTTEFDEPLPIPLRFSNNNYCLTPYHGMLCMVGTILMGLSIVSFRILQNLKTRLVKIVHTIINAIAIAIIIAGIIETNFETVHVEVVSAFHIVASWVVMACLFFEFLTAILFFWILFGGSNNRLFLAPFHDIFGIWIFICLVGCCLSGKRVLIGDYSAENAFKFYCFTYAAFIIVLIILLSPWFEWDLVGPM